MSNLVAIAYPDRESAEQVRRTLVELQKEHVIELDDMVVITRAENGKVKLHQSTSLAGAGAAGGALWGGLIGLLFLAPVVVSAATLSIRRVSVARYRARRSGPARSPESRRDRVQCRSVWSY